MFYLVSGTNALISVFSRWCVYTLGGFRVEMQKDVHQPRTIVCRYDPSEPGMYAIQVMWSGTHIPGSPFLVQICATRAELERLTSSIQDWSETQQQFNGNRAFTSQLLDARTSITND